MSDPTQVLNKPTGEVVDIEQLFTLLPHRYPFLLIDQLRDIVLGESATGIKNVTFNEWFFAGHFPQKPVMPGVMIVEALAQTSAALVMHTLKKQGENIEKAIVYFMSVEGARFRKPVLPGHCLDLKVTRVHRRANMWKFKGEALASGVLMADATYTAMITTQP